MNTDAAQHAAVPRGAPPEAPETGLFSLADLSVETVTRLAERSVELHRDRAAHDRPLAGATVGVLFTKPSTRTRTAFTVAAVRLGAVPVTYGPGDLQLSTGEAIEDTGRVFGGMLDGLVARTAGPLAELRRLSRSGHLPVVNAMATEEHPSQGLCDLATLRLCLGDDLRGLRLLYVGEGNNTAAALALALAGIPGCEATFACPPGYGLPDDLVSAAGKRAARNGAVIDRRDSAADLPSGVDVVYTTRWQTTGTSKPDAAWRERFRAFHVDEEFMTRRPGALLLHDLPAHRGDEVTGAVLDGPRSVAWTQASMKLSSAMAVLEWALGPQRRPGTYTGASAA
ncbi:ornithine carbamoyltransferase [Streptomyces kanamyceticus]|uniref:Ornithine carbamoyltransferase n=1 Tax=Streptomyces kanamyceticus TaxID=1967 RepID=A0A5J6G622_STRKN|nr:ornithine carbamoyltransferase [Streptomyces kanamyceticus]QEU90387.1 ornithine carbamoyltransferase [Streptomyces kanamyceticus]